MDLSERMTWLIMGCVIGFLLGYIVRALREIKEELNDVDQCVKKCREAHEHIERHKDERGMAMPRYTNHVALVIVLLITVFAAFSSQKSSNEVRATQLRVIEIATCNQTVLTQTIKALNQRTEYTIVQAQSNVELQKAQTEFLSILVTQPKPTENIRDNALDEYFEKLTEFVMVSGQTVNKAENNPYPTTEDLAKCLAEDQ